MSSYLKSILTGYSYTILSLIIGLFLAPFTLSFLSREEYGIFQIGLELVVLLGIFNLGFSSSLNILTSRMPENVKQVNSLASTTFLAQIVLGIIGFLFGLFIANNLNILFEVDPSYENDARWTVILFSFSFMVVMFTKPFSELLFAYQKIHQDNIIRIVLLLVRTGLIVFFLIQGFKIISLGIAFIVSEIIIAILSVIRVGRGIPHIKINVKSFSMKALKQLFGLGVWFSIGAISIMLIEKVDKIIVGKIIGLAQVTTLALTGRVYSIIQGLIYQITNNYRPVFGRLFGKGEKELVYNQYRFINSISTGLAILAGTSLLMINEAFVGIWVGEENYGGIWLDVALVINLIFHCWKLPYRAVLSANAIVRPQSIASIIEGIVNVGLSIFLGYRFGLVGIVAATFIAGILCQIVYLPYLISKVFDKSFTTVFFKNNFSSFLFMIIALSITYLVRTSITFNNLSILYKFLMTGVVGSILLFGFYLLNRKMFNPYVHQLKQQMLRKID